MPSRRPEVVALVILDEPKGKYFGGEVAAPVFGAIMARVLPYLGIAPGQQDLPPALVQPKLESEAVPPPLLARSLQSAPEAEVPDGAIPDLRGLTAREAIRMLAQRGLTPRLHGSGFVHTQTPLPWQPVERAEGEVEIWLGARS